LCFAVHFSNSVNNLNFDVEKNGWADNNQRSYP